jgi:hypothetical protein
VWAVALLLCVGAGVAAWIFWNPFALYNPPGNQPSKEEMKALLTGQTLSRWSSGPLGDNPKRPPITIQEVEALEIGETRSQGGDGRTWKSELEFIAKAKEGRYAVRGYLSHRLIEGKRAFLEFEIQTATKQ